MAPKNPLGLENTVQFWAWAISEDGLRLLVFWPAPGYGSPVGTLRFHLSDQDDAVHVLVTRSAELPTSPTEWKQGSLLMHSEYHAAEVNLPGALGDRPIVDATEGIARPQVSSGGDFTSRFWLEEHVSFGEASMAAFAAFERSEQLRWSKARWSYDDTDHRIVDFEAAPGSFDESRAVPVTAFNRGT